MTSSKLFDENCFVFLAGLHRSGTSLLHEIMRSHPEISGFANTGVPEDEGQHLQAVYEPAFKFGGPGKFALHKDAYMDETHVLATRKNAEILFSQWRGYWDLDCRFLLEKSPVNIIRTRFLQKMFPQSIFIVIVRHPVVVALATHKWFGTSIPVLLDHTLKAYDKFFQDMKFLHKVLVIRYEDFVLTPQENMDAICRFIGVNTFQVTQVVCDDINAKYFKQWGKYIQATDSSFLGDLAELEKSFNKVGYSLKTKECLPGFTWSNAP